MDRLTNSRCRSSASRFPPDFIQTLAANLAARAFAETEFVTDKRGSEIATRLEHWPAYGITHIWALGKLVACALQEQAFVQFDGDVPTDVAKSYFARSSSRDPGMKCSRPSGEIASIVGGTAPDVLHRFAFRDAIIRLPVMTLKVSPPIGLICPRPR